MARYPNPHEKSEAAMNRKRVQAQLNQFGVALSNEKSQKGWITKPIHEAAESHYFPNLSSALAYWNRIAMSHLEHRYVMDQIFNHIFDTGSQEEKEQFIRWIRRADAPPEIAYRAPVTPFEVPKNWRKTASAIFTPDKPIDRSWADYYARDKLDGLEVNLYTK